MRGSERRIRDIRKKYISFNEINTFRLERRLYYEKQEKDKRLLGILFFL